MDYQLNAEFDDLCFDDDLDMQTWEEQEQEAWQWEEEFGDKPLAYCERCGSVHDVRGECH